MDAGQLATLDLAEGRAVSDDQLRRLESAVLAAPQQELPVRHFIGHGMATRVILIPAGTVIVGHRHKQGQHNFLMQGRLRVTTDEGVRELCAPEVIVSPPGAKRVAVTLTDVIWATTLTTDLTDPDAIFADVLDFTDLPPVLPEGLVP